MRSTASWSGPCGAGCKRRQAEPVPHLGVDEKAFRKGHKYLTMVNDLTRGRVLYVAEDRKQASLDGFWGTLTAEPAEGHPGRGDGHVGSLRGLGARARRPKRTGRSSSTSSMSPSIWAKPWTRCGGRRTRPCAPKGDDRLVGTRYDWLEQSRHDGRRRTAGSLPLYATAN